MSDDDLAKRRLRLRNIVVMAFADGSLGEREVNLVADRCAELGLDHDDLRKAVEFGLGDDAAIELPTDSTDRESLMQDLIRIMAADGMQRVAELLLCLERLCDCHQARLLASEGFVVCHRESADSRMTVALDYINRHFRDWELRASQLATLVNMNGSAFSRRFRNVTGHTPTTYINRVRLGYSRRLLLDQANSVTDVCHESGFSSLSHFSKLFRARYAMSPSEFREAHLVACNSATG